MKKKMLFLGSLFTASLLFGEDNVIVNTLVTCDNGAPGFQTVISNPGTDKTVRYNSCEQNGIGVYNSSGDRVASGDSSSGSDSGSSSIPSHWGGNINDGFVGQDVTITGEVNMGRGNYQDVTRNYTFVAGYTEPTTEANNDCSSGYNDSYGWSRQYCGYSEGDSRLTEEGGLPEGFLNMVTASDYTTFSGKGIKNIDNLANLQMINNGGLYITGTDITNVDGLKNLLGMSNQNSPSYSGSDWGTDKLSNSGSHRGIDLKNNSKLENVNGLSNLRSTDWLDLTGNSSLNDISGLSTLEIRPSSHSNKGVYLDDRNYDTKLSADSWLCQNPSYIKTSRDGSVIEYSKVCN